MSLNTISLTPDGKTIVLNCKYRYKDDCRARGLTFIASDIGWGIEASRANAKRVYEGFGNIAHSIDPAFTELLGEDPSLVPPLDSRDSTPPEKYVLKPYSWQCIGYNMIRTQPGAMLDHDMGTGKTKTVIDSIINLDCLLTLVIAPKTVMKKVWRSEFEKHGLGLFEGRVLLPSGSVSQRANMTLSAIRLNQARKRPLVVLINYDSVWRPSFARVITAYHWDMVVCDESHRIKSPFSKVSKFIGQELGRRARYKVCLSGTPLGSPMDAFGQARFLDPTLFGTMYVRFRSRYASLGGYEKREIMGFRHLDEFYAKWYQIAHRVRKSDVLELPKFVHETRSVELDAETRRAYRQMQSMMVAQITEGVLTARNGLSKLLKLQQLTSGYGMVDEESTQIGSDKAKALLEVFEDIRSDEPIVVFARFRHDLDRILEKASDDDRVAYELSGRTNELTAWQNSTGGEVLAVQIQAGGVGVDLTRACYAVYYSVGFSLLDYEQSLARVHRPGQERSVTYIHLVAENTVDEQVYAALDGKKSVVEYILDSLPGHRKEQVA